MPSSSCQCAEGGGGEGEDEGNGMLSSLLSLLCGDEVMGDGDGDSICMCGKGMWRDNSALHHRHQLTCRC